MWRVFDAIAEREYLGQRPDCDYMLQNTNLTGRTWSKYAQRRDVKRRVSRCRLQNGRFSDTVHTATICFKR
jgi:hypothetical protein